MADNYKSMKKEDFIREKSINPKQVLAYKGFYNCYIKRLMDFILALLFLILLLPVYLIVSAAIVLDSGFPILYCADRGGYQGKSFRIRKFRTMVKDAEQLGGGTTALNDTRITRIGAILRKTKLDETANLINILRGEMSFIGPRPELLKYTNAYKDAEMLILQVRPGITDYSSLEFINLDEIVGSRNPEEQYEKFVLEKKNRLRIYYAATVSFQTDIGLFFSTIGKVLQKIAGLCKGKEKKWNT